MDAASHRARAALAVINERKQVMRGLRFLKGLCASTILLFTSQSAWSAQYDTLATFSIGSGAGQLGVNEGDTAVEIPAFTVGANGTVAIADVVNYRLVVLNSDFSVRYTKTLVGDHPETALALSDGQVVAMWYGANDALARYGTDGTEQVRGKYSGILEAELPNGSILLQTQDHAKPFVVLDRGFLLQGAYADRPLSIGQIKSVGPVAVVQSDTICAAFADVLASSQNSIFGNALFLLGGGPAKVDLSSRILTVWKLPPAQYVQPVDRTLGRPPIIWTYGHTTIGADQNFYSMARTPSQLSIIRWNLSQLSSKTYPPPVLKSLTIQPSSVQNVATGTTLTAFVDAAGGQGVKSFSASGLPSGATLDTNLAGPSCAIRWVPQANQVGPYTVTVTAQDQACQTASTTVEIKVTQ
jgi:hypothetical protein